MEEAKRYTRLYPREEPVGTGAACDRVEKWTDTVLGRQVAVKIVPERLEYLALQEIRVLQRILLDAVRRVANLLDHLKGSDGSTYLILELVDGFNLYQYSVWRNDPNFDLDFEAKMLTVAVQLIETLSELHNVHKAHLDVKGDNVMLAQNFDCLWDNVRLIDFAMAARCNPESAVRDVLPQGHAFGASAPELMSASEKIKQGLSDDQCKINGCAADMWSAGTVLYEMLTGQRAFNPTVPEGNVPPAQTRDDWPSTVAKQTDALRCHISSAQSHSGLVQHPMFRAIAECSSSPELAVAFFKGLFESVPTKRMTAVEALRHPYLQDCCQEMQRARQGTPICKYQRQPTKPRTGRWSKLKSIYGKSGSRDRDPNWRQQRQGPHDLDWFFPPYQMPRSR